jgi:class 3 adenylate cyclase/alpha-beta hydrolase superfamily lysophospholipase
VIRPPEIRYARTDDGMHIAYQVVGSGPVDLVVVLGWTTNIEALWQQPPLARFLYRLADTTRLMLYDKRGMGLSDRVAGDRLPSFEARMDDTRAVMDAVGSERAVVFGVSEGGPLSSLFAATYPHRTLGLIIYGSGARYGPAPDYPWGSPDDAFEAYLTELEGRWGTRDYAADQVRGWGAPSHAQDEALIDWLTSYMRGATSPGGAVALSRMNRGIDVRAVLPAIHVPTLVIGRSGDLDFSPDEVRAMAAAIHGARMVELPGDDHFFWLGDQESILTEVERFIASIRMEEAELDRVLATVLVTDIVGSTERLATIGDRAWRELLDRHHGLIRALLARYRGREVDTAGDGFLATFDGPVRAVRCALAIVEAAADLDLEIRAGCHTGEVELDGSAVRGIAVHVGARVAATAGPGEVLVSSTVRDLVAGSGLTFDDRGAHHLKGIDEPVRLFAARAGAGSAPVA